MIQIGQKMNTLGPKSHSEKARSERLLRQKVTMLNSVCLKFFLLFIFEPIKYVVLKGSHYGF